MMKLTALAVDENAAAVWLDKAHQNTQEGRFSRAVAAAQRMDRATPQGEFSVFQRHDRTKGFFYAGHFQQISGLLRVRIACHSETSG